MIMSARSAPSELFCVVLKWFGFLKKANSCVAAITNRVETIVPLWHVSCHPPCRDCTVDGNW